MHIKQKNSQANIHEIKMNPKYSLNVIQSSLMCQCSQIDNDVHGGEMTLVIKILLVQLIPEDANKTAALLKPSGGHRSHMQCNSKPLYEVSVLIAVDCTELMN